MASSEQLEEDGLRQRKTALEAQEMDSNSKESTDLMSRMLQSTKDLTDLPSATKQIVSSVLAKSQKFPQTNFPLNPFRLKGACTQQQVSARMWPLRPRT